MPKVVIRRAVKPDCKRLYKLAQEAALSRQVAINSQLTVEGLERDGFGSSPLFHCIVAESDGRLIGYVLYYFTYSGLGGRTICMEDIFANKMHLSVTKKLWQKLIKVALLSGCLRCHMAVMGDNLKRKEFYAIRKAINITETEGWHFFRVDQEAMEVFDKGKKIKGVTIRESNPEDCAGLRQLMLDLGDHLMLESGSPQIITRVLKEDGFGDKSLYKCYIAEQKGKLVGYTLFFFTYNWDGPGVYMEDLYVAPSHRSQGIGLALWGKLIEAGLDLRCNRCDFAVQVWNTKAIKFYLRNGAVNMTVKSGFMFYKMTRELMEECVKPI